MKPLKNQPFDLGFSETCECGENTFEQFFFNTDRIEIAFDLETCGIEPFILSDEDISTALGSVTIDGQLALFTSGGSVVLNLPNPLPAGYYAIQVTIPSYTQGQVSLLIDNVTIANFTSSGVFTVYTNIAQDEPAVQIGTTSGTIATVNLQLQFQAYPQNQQAFLIDAGGNLVAEIDSFKRGNQIVFNQELADLTLSECRYRIGWTDECSQYSFGNPVFFTNFFNIIPSTNECTVALSGCYPASQFGWPEDFNPLVRVTGRLAQPQYAGEIIRSRDSFGYTKISYSDRIKTMQLKVNLVPEYILDFISVWVSFENMYINGQSYRISEDSFPEVIYPDATDLGQLDITVERVRQDVLRKTCNEAIAPCEEVPPPPPFLTGSGKLFQDGVEFLFQDGIGFNFE